MRYIWQCKAANLRNDVYILRRQVEIQTRVTDGMTYGNSSTLCYDMKSVTFNSFQNYSISQRKHWGDTQPTKTVPSVSKHRTLRICRWEIHIHLTSALNEGSRTGRLQSTPKERTVGINWTRSRSGRAIAWWCIEMGSPGNQIWSSNHFTDIVMGCIMENTNSSELRDGSSSKITLTDFMKNKTVDTSAFRCWVQTIWISRCLLASSLLALWRLNSFNDPITWRVLHIWIRT